VVDAPAPARRVEDRAGQRATSESLTILTGDASYVYSIRLGGETAWAVGAQLSPLNADLARALGAERGVLVLDVSRRSPAAQSGLRGGDVILAADGQVLLRPSDLLERMNASGSRELKLEVVRLKKIETVTLRWRGDGGD
jgi:membrane-associated protease RseP (regulator of RpoE activity)